MVSAMSARQVCRLSSLRLECWPTSWRSACRKTSAALHDCRNNRLMWAAVLQIRDAIDEAIRRHGPSRVGVILGTSTGGMSEQERARGQLARTGDWPAGSHYRQWEVGALSEYVAL